MERTVKGRAGLVQGDVFSPRPAPPIKIDALTKRFGDTVALDGVSLEIRPGEVVGLMGPNGAGKSTLIKILAGVYSADSGSITVGGAPVRSLSERRDVAFVHQDLGLVEDMSIRENLRIGQDALRAFGPILSKRKEEAAARQALASVKLELDLSLPVSSLPPGEKTLVAIARAFDRGATVIIVDESTSNLPPSEAAKVIEALSDRAREGAAVIMVTHKLHEILTATTRVVVLLDGKVAADQTSEDLDRVGLVRLLTDQETVEPLSGDIAVTLPALTRPHGVKGAEVLRLENARTREVGPVDISLKRGEIVGLTGLPGSGLYDVAMMLAGVAAIVSGKEAADPNMRRGFVPPHRETQGGFADFTVRQNLTISSLFRWRGRDRLLRLGQERADADALVAELDVRPRDGGVGYGGLSGGNKQKVIMGRVLMKNPDLYVLCEPTRGVDVKARAEIYALIRSARDHGAAVVIVTSDAEDILSICDTVALVEDRTVGQPRLISELSLEELEVMV